MHMDTGKLLTLFVLLNVMDVILTMHILAAGGIEAIPTSRWLIETFGYIGLGAFKVTAGALVAYFLLYSVSRFYDGRRVVVALNVALAAVCAWNWLGLVGGYFA